MFKESIITISSQRYFNNTCYVYRDVGTELGRLKVLPKMHLVRMHASVNFMLVLNSYTKKLLQCEINVENGMQDFRW